MGKESNAWAFDERWYYLNCNNWVFFFFPLKRNTVRTNLYAFGKADAGSFDTAFMELQFMKKNYTYYTLIACYLHVQRKFI